MNRLLYELQNAKLDLAIAERSLEAIKRQVPRADRLQKRAKICSPTADGIYERLFDAYDEWERAFAACDRANAAFDRANNR